MKRKTQHEKKVVSNSPGLVDFGFGLVNSALNLPNGQVNFLGKLKLQKDCNQYVVLIKKVFVASYSLPKMAGCKTDFLCTLRTVFLQVHVNCKRWL